MTRITPGGGQLWPPVQLIWQFQIMPDDFPMGVGLIVLLSPPNWIRTYIELIKTFKTFRIEDLHKQIHLSCILIASYVIISKVTQIMSWS